MKNRKLNLPGESRFFPNAVALAVQTVLGTVLTLAQIKILSNFLSADTFGLFASLRGFSMLLALLAANGLPHLLIRFLPAHESAHERARALRLGLFALLGSIVLLGLFGLVVSGLREWFLEFVDASALGDGFWLWFWLTTASVMLKQVVYGGLQGLRRMTQQVPVELASLAGVLAWVFLTRDELSITALFRILAVINTISLGIAVFLFLASVARIASGPRPDGAGNGYSDYLFGAVGISVVAVAFTDVDRYVIAHVLQLQFVALFHIAAGITRTTSRLLASANTAIQPEITRLCATGREPEVDPLARLFLKFNSAIAVLFAFAVALFARDLILLVASESYAPAMPLLVILAACIPLSAAVAPLTTVMKATDQVRSALWVDLIWAVVYVTLILLLAPAFGVIGIGLANLAACLAQITTAIRLSALSITAGLAGGLLARLVLGAGVVFAPLMMIMQLGMASDGGSLFLRLVLLVAGALAYFRMQRVLRVFSPHERGQLVTWLTERRLSVLARAL